MSYHHSCQKQFSRFIIAQVIARWPRSCRPFRCMLLACMLMVSAPLAALTFNVNTTVDSVDANTADGVCADGSGNCSLRAAVMQSNASSGFDTINLPAGTYALTIGSGSSDLDASIGDLDLSSGGATFVGAGAATTIIDAAAISHRIFHIPVDIFFSGLVSFSDLTLRGGNSTGVGGGGAAVDAGSRFASSITFTRVVVTGNTGGSAIRTLADTVINASVVSNNSGNGLFQTNDAANPGDNVKTLDISDSTFEGNGGSGIAIGNNDGGSLVNSTVSGNGADGFSAQFTTFSDFIITNSTIANNGRDGISGVGFTFIGTPLRPDILVRNSIIADNTRSDVTTPALDAQAEVPQSDGFNLVSDNSAAVNFTGPSDLNNTDPMLLPIALNAPGTTRTHALAPGSPAIDHASASFAPAADQRGIVRPQGAADDSGAFEFIPTVSDLAVTKSADVTDALPGDPVVFTIEVSNNGPDGVVGAPFADTPDASFEKISWSCQASGGASCTASGSGAINDAVDLPVGAGVTYTVNTIIAAGAQNPAVNTATIAAPAGGSDPSPGNNLASASVNVDNSADLELTALQCVDLTAPSLTHQYAVQVFNNGPNPAPMTTVEVQFPVDFNLISSPLSCADNGGVQLCDEGTINAGQGIELVFIVEIDAQAADGPRDSDFMVASARPDNQPGNNLALLTTTVLANLVATDSFESCGDS